VASRVDRSGLTQSKDFENQSARTTLAGVELTEAGGEVPLVKLRLVLGARADFVSAYTMGERTSLKPRRTVGDSRGSI